MVKTFACDATTGWCSPDPRGSLTQQSCEASCDVAPPPCAGASDTFEKIEGSLPVGAFWGLMGAVGQAAGALAAKPCFQAHERHQRLWHTPSSYDSVPLGLVAMAHGDVSAAVAALSAAYKTDPKATQKLLERAAAAIAPT